MEHALSAIIEKCNLQEEMRRNHHDGSATIICTSASSRSVSGTVSVKEHRRRRRQCKTRPGIYRQSTLLLETALGILCVVLQGTRVSPGATWANDAHVASAMLVKLLVDMWLTAGPAASLPLALLLLRRCGASPLPALRRRAFDLLANLQVRIRP